MKKEKEKHKEKCQINLTAHMLGPYYSPFLLASWRWGAGLIVFVLSMACDPKWIMNLLLVGFNKPTVRLLVTFIRLVTKPPGMLPGQLAICYALIGQMTGCGWD